MAYREQDAERWILMKSDDGGVSWYAVGGDPTNTFLEQDCMRAIVLGSADAGTTWTPDTLQ